MTTTTVKPRTTRKRGRPAKRRKTMIEHSPLKETTPEIVTEQPKSINLVESHLDDIYLIERDALWDDFKNRIKINNYEVKKVMEDFKKVVTETNRLASPYVNKAVDKVKALRSE
tara:strand:+ start:1094 stop:1435 length:342 start_codon:yes stop_codon:yes gene_type:complete